MKPIEVHLIGRIPSKKNSRITNKKTGRTFPSKDYTKWHHDAIYQLLIQGAQKNKISTPLFFDIILYFGDLHCADVTNKEESVMDLLKDYGTILDDSWIICREKHVIAKYEKGKWGAEIIISQFEGTDNV